MRGGGRGADRSGRVHLGGGPAADAGAAVPAPELTARRAAVLGGTLDPVHRGHLAVAGQAREVLGADEAWLVPAGEPPHRCRAAASAQDRLAMVEAAVAGHPHLRAVDVEVRRPAASYTIDTLELLSRRWPATQVWWVLGADAARGIRGWHRAEELLARGRFLLVNRTGEEEMSADEARSLGFDMARTRLARIDSPPVSGREIRRAVAAGEPLGDRVPEAVAAIIRSRDLYRNRVP